MLGINPFKLTEDRPEALDGGGGHVGSGVRTQASTVPGPTEMAMVTSSTASHSLLPTHSCIGRDS